MGSTLEFRKAFVQRLKQACDESPVVPPPHKGRQQYISQQLGVAPEAVSKWFKAVSMPRPDKMVRLSELLQVEQTWLAFGVSPEMDRQERKAHAREVDGAVHYVMGLTMLAGGHCGLPSSRDPRSSFVDFYATVRGSVYMIHVCLAREMSEGRYEVLVPKEFNDVNIVTVIPVSKGKHHLIEMPADAIEEHKVRKSGSYSIIVDHNPQNRYTTGHSIWPRIRYFGETK